MPSGKPALGSGGCCADWFGEARIRRSESLALCDSGALFRSCVSRTFIRSYWEEKTAQSSDTGQASASPQVLAQICRRYWDLKIMLSAIAR
ncbi:hypothetical protein KL938_004810 [Ogataea parapolymorpha]|nr:hypothetical protein KL938_004810 [Ogataea parapolymorpha]